MPPKRAAPKSYEKARKLRKELTPAERKLWAHIRNDQLGVNFRRQHAIGDFIPDFVCIKKKLIVELDGGQHAEQAEYDADRTRFLESHGYKVIRFWNNDVMNDINGVIRNIQFALEENQGVSV
ncbi:MAG: endonuclease domain-containing protein [Chloroflexi bacterium]|nr:MAG: endonuclease domain-containing protein [Chloroflexota bacterium]